MRVIIHADNLSLEIEEHGSSTHLRAKDTSTQFVMERSFELGEFLLFTQFRSVAQALVDGVRPQLEAAQPRT